MPTHESEQRRHLSPHAARAVPPASTRRFPQPGPSPRSPSLTASLCRDLIGWPCPSRLFCHSPYRGLPTLALYHHLLSDLVAGTKLSVRFEIFVSNRRCFALNCSNLFLRYVL